MGFNPVDLAFGNMDALRSSNAQLRELLADCHALLQRCCDSQDEHGEGCPMWPDHGDDCDLRKVERRMVELGIGADCGAATRVGVDR